MNADSYASTGQGFLGYNMYAYCNNSPVKYSDAGGNMRVSEGDAGNYSTNAQPKVLGDRALDCLLVTVSATTVEIGAGVGFGGNCEIAAGPVPFSIGAQVANTDKLIASNLQGDIRNSTSYTVGISFGDMFGSSVTHGYDHSYFDPECTCNVWHSSVGEKSQCKANKDMTQQSNTIGFSAGVYFVIGGEMSISFDVEAWADDIVAIFS